MEPYKEIEARLPMPFPLGTSQVQSKYNYFLEFSRIYLEICR